jgi:hypothetical protein
MRDFAAEVFRDGLAHVGERIAHCQRVRRVHKQLLDLSRAGDAAVPHPAQR